LIFKQTPKTCGTLILLHKSKRRPKAGEEGADNSSMISILVTKAIMDGVATIATMDGVATITTLVGVTTTTTTATDGEMKTATMDGEMKTTTTMDGEIKAEIKAEIKVEIKVVLFGVIFRVETGSMKCRNTKEMSVLSN
jgi:hypothetical protein